MLSRSWSGSGAVLGVGTDGTGATSLFLSAVAMIKKDSWLLTNQLPNFDDDIFSSFSQLQDKAKKVAAEELESTKKLEEEIRDTIEG